MQSVKPELTGFRDEGLAEKYRQWGLESTIRKRPRCPSGHECRRAPVSSRHRTWGYDCPAVDLDSLEYDHRIARAIIEYKRQASGPPPVDDANTEALCDLADRADIPLYQVVYSADFTTWTVLAINSLARHDLCHQPVRWSEFEFVYFLYETVRGRGMPKEVADALRSKK